MFDYVFPVSGLTNCKEYVTGSHLNVVSNGRKLSREEYEALGFFDGMCREDMEKQIEKNREVAQR